MSTTNDLSIKPGAIVKYQDGSIYILRERHPLASTAWWPITIVETNLEITGSFTIIEGQFEVIGQMPRGWDRETKI